MKILQSNNRNKFKGVCLKLIQKFGVLIINRQPQISKTQGFIKKLNRTIKI